MKRFLVGLLALSMTLATISSALAIGRPTQTIYGMRIDQGTKTATAVAGAATLNKLSGVVTSEALVTAAAALYTLTITDSAISATDLVLVTVQNGTNTTGAPDVITATPAAGSLVIVIRNSHLSVAFNGTLKIGFVALKN